MGKRHIGLAGPADAPLNTPPENSTIPASTRSAVRTLLVPDREGEIQWMEPMLGSLGQDPPVLLPPFTAGPMSAAAQAKGSVIWLEAAKSKY